VIRTGSTLDISQCAFLENIVRERDIILPPLLSEREEDVDLGEFEARVLIINCVFSALEPPETDVVSVMECVLVTELSHECDSLLRSDAPSYGLALPSATPGETASLVLNHSFGIAGTTSLLGMAWDFWISQIGATSAIKAGPQLTMSRAREVLESDVGPPRHAVSKTRSIPESEVGFSSNVVPRVASIPEPDAGHGRDVVSQLVL
jgi:hypothetical protein